MFRSSRQILRLLQVGSNSYKKTNCLNNSYRLCTYIEIRRCITIYRSSMGDKPDEKNLRQCLSPLQYHVTQEKGTEIPYTGKYANFFEPGIYVCVVCKSKIFSSKTKYDSGCGWPAFSDVVDPKNVKLTTDTSHGMIRTEVTCSNCGAHLGHVFDDGPKPTGLRYCINSASLDFYLERS